MNNVNYEEYLARMTDSLYKTTKRLIPIYAKEFLQDIKEPKILDVGCGFGEMGHVLKKYIPNAWIMGIDINEKNINTIIKHNNPYDQLECIDINSDYMEDEKYENYFDLIIFSSVLHEIGSYATEDVYMKRPIINTLKNSYSLIKTGGYIIIRDGIALDEEIRNDIEEYDIQDSYTVSKFVQFLNEFNGYSNSFKIDKSISIEMMPSSTLVKSKITCPRWLMNEFLCTITWGDELWSKEVTERFLYRSAEEYRDILEELGLHVIVEIHTAEEYPEYFKKFIVFPPTDDIVGFFIAKKEN